MNKILILEDDRKLNDGIRLALRREDCTFLQCQTIEEARELLKKEKVRLNPSGSEPSGRKRSGFSSGDPGKERRAGDHHYCQ